MTRLLGEGFLLGLSTGTFCLLSCAPLLVPFLLAGGAPDFKSNAALMGRFFLGRLAAYLLFGFVIGIFGERFAAKIPDWMISSAMILSGVLMIGYALSNHFRNLSLCRFLPQKLFSKPMPVLLGFAVGINVCPPFMAGAVRVFELANPLKGAVYFSSFFVGTSLYLLPLIAAGSLSKIHRLKSVGVLACLLSGVWFIFQGLVSLFI